MENGIDIQKLLKIIRQSWLLMLVFALVGAASCFTISKFIVPKKYASTVSLLVNRQINNLDAGAQFANQQADVQLISTYKNIISQPIILNTVAKNLSTDRKEVTVKAKDAEYIRNRFGEKIKIKDAVPAVYKYIPAKYKLKATSLEKMVSISNDNNSQVFNITVKTGDPQESADIANEISSVFKQKIVKLMSVKNVSVVSEAMPIKKPVSPSVKLYTVIGAILGITITFLIAIIRELTNRTIKSFDFFNDKPEINDLGTMHFVGNVSSYKDFINKKANMQKAHRRRV